MLNILSAFAEFERDLIRRRTRSGRLAVWKNNVKTIGSLPFGYARPDKEIIILKDKEKIYHDIVSLYLDQGYSIRDIAIKLKGEGIPSPSGKSPNWYGKTINDILKNPAYTGEAIQNRFKTNLYSGKSGQQYYGSSRDPKPEDEWIPMTFPQLISKERFDQIQARIEEQKRKPKKRHYGYEDHFLVDSLLYCGHCGARVRKQFTPTANFHYCCYWYSASPKDLEIFNRKKCPLHYHNAENIDYLIFYYVSELMADPQKFSTDWFKQSDIDELNVKCGNLRNRHKELLEILSNKFNRICSVKDPELKNRLQVEIDKEEEEYKINKRNLQIAEFELKSLDYKVNHLEEYQKRMKGSRRLQFSTYFKTKNQFQGFIFQLPFKEKKRIIEAVISPETNGKIFLENDPEIPDHFVLRYDFKLNIDKIEKIISNLNKSELFNNVDVG